MEQDDTIARRARSLIDRSAPDPYLWGMR